MSDQTKLALILVVVAVLFCVIALFSPDYIKKDFGKVINEYQIKGKSDQANPEDIRKGFQ